MDLGLAGRVAIVTGGSRGIGAAIAGTLSAEGCRVAVVARTGGTPPGGMVIHADLTAEGAATVAVDSVVAEWGQVDILVNNAGGNTPRKLSELTDDGWREGFELNFFAAVRMAQMCVPHMQRRGWGRIVNIASTYGREPDPYFGPYSAAKAALINYSKNLARAFSAGGVLTNCVIPGVTLTELVEANATSAAAASGTTPDEVMAKVMAKDPVAAGRFGQTSEIAAAVAFLVSEQASWITGACLTVDGGTLRAC